MNAVVVHTLMSGRIMRICLRCSLKVTESGAPDPYFYSEAWINRFLSSPESQRCKHEKSSSSTVVTHRDLSPAAADRQGFTSGLLVGLLSVIAGLIVASMILASYGLKLVLVPR